MKSVFKRPLSYLFMVGLLLFSISCSKRVKETEFSKNLKKDRESGKTYTPEEWRRALGINYDILIQGIGEESFNVLSYGVGISNMTALINAIGDGNKLVALMSDPNKLSAVDVLDMLLQTNTAVSWPGASSTNVIQKVANLINSVNLGGMQALKEIIRGLEPTQSFDVGDPGIANGKRAMLRMGYFLALVDENQSVLPTIINQVAAPGGNYSSQGTRRLMRLLNEVHDVKELAVIINQTTNLSNITSIIAGLTEDDTCTANNPATGKPYTTQAACLANGGTWNIGTSRDGIAAMIRVINESGVCSNPTHKTKSACRLALATWTSNANKLSQIVNYVSNVNNLNEIMNNLTNDGTPGSDKGVDAMVATLNNITNVHRLTYVVNNLDTVPTASNDENFDNGTDCSNGLFANRLGLAFSANGPSGSPWWGHGWRSGTGIVDSGTCSARTNPTAATEDTRVLVMEMTANVLSTGNLTFRAYTNLSGGATFKLYVNNVNRLNISSPSTWNTFSYAIPSTGRYRFRWELVRPLGNTSQVWVDTIVVPGDKGAARTAAEKVAIMLNKLRINSITNVAEIMNGVTAPACVNTPHMCTPSNDNGLDALIGIINRVEYPNDINTDPKLVTIVKDLTSVPTMVDILNGLNGNGFERMVFAIDFNNNASNLVGLVNGLTGVNAGGKITGVVNNLTAAGASNLVRLIDNVPNRNLQILINNIPSTGDVATILNNLVLNGKDVAINTSAGADGGEKLAAVFNELQAVSTANGHWASCSKVFGETPTSQIYVNPPYGPYGKNPNENLFCIENHLARLVIDIGSFSGGAVNVAKIVSYLDPDAATQSGMRRMIEVMWALRTMDPTRYNDATSNATADVFGRLTTLVGDMGANGGYNIASLVNNTTYSRLNYLTYMVQNVNRIKYLSRLVSETGNVSLIQDLLNHPNTTDIARIERILDIAGDATANFGDPTPKYPTNNTGGDRTKMSPDHDKLGKLISLINNVSGGIGNVIDLVNGVQITPTDKFPILTDLILNAERMVYINRTINEATNINLVVSLINNSPNSTRLMDLINTMGNATYGTAVGQAADVSPKYGDNPSGTGCASMPGYPNGKGCDTNATDRLGKMIVMINEITNIGNTVALMNNTDSTAYNSYVKPLLQESDRIRYITEIVNGVSNVSLFIGLLNGLDPDGAGPLPSTRADYTQLRLLINNVGGSTRRGSTTKAVGNMDIVEGTINELGWDTGCNCARTEQQQARIVRIINETLYCGLKPSVDRTVTNPTASDFLTCDTHVNYPYNKLVDSYDRRHRLSNFMLGMTTSTPVAIIVGNVIDTGKTIKILNGVRRINTVIKAVDWMPGPVTRDLVNYTADAAIYRAFVYLANNLEPDEDMAAVAFSSMIHFGTQLSEARTSGTCNSYEGIGPKRLANILNVETGLYLEGIIAMFGWRVAIPALVCAFGSTNVAEPQSLPNAYPNAPMPPNPSYSFWRVEDVRAVDGGEGNARGNGTGQSGAVLFTYNAPGATTCQLYYPETSGAMGHSRRTDRIIWEGWSPWSLSVQAGIAGVWDVLKGNGIIGWLISNGGEIGMPPLTTPGETPRCSDDSNRAPWPCFSDNFSGGVWNHRYGNYCSVPGYTTPPSCQAAAVGGRWLANKNYNHCRTWPADFSGPPTKIDY